jgi:hypothetical protein
MIEMGAVKALGRLESVDLRDVWEDEARDFTPWLAGETNLAVLGQTVGLELEFEKQGGSGRTILSRHSLQEYC